MGQKVSPIGMRVGVIRDWQSRWYADDKEFGTLLMEDVKIREFIESYYTKLSNEAQDKRKADPQISRIEIERTKGRMTVIIRTAHPGVVIGQDGKSIEGLKKKIEKMASAKNVQINVVEVANPNLDARLVARWIANELEARKSFRATQKKAIQNTMRAGAKGIKTAVSGRLGVKVWICRGEVLPGEMVKEPEAPKQRPMRKGKGRRRPARNPRQAAPAQNAEAPVEKGGNTDVNA